jgi:hypothetical protein
MVMTGERAEAYGRVVAILGSAVELDTTERQRLRDAADALLFAAAAGVETAEALTETQAVSHALVDSGRWSRQRAGELMAAMRACGPEGLPAWPSQNEPRFLRRSLWRTRR